ncbi:MAG: beta-hydroxyacyl-ACP dehydratase [Planctomycetes bacterium]|nr:beta-hydroxyacyl-ACP dehydratase [Planctomycetota bacterium]
MNTAIGVDAIPHRPPFLFVDDIVEVTGDRIVTRMQIDPDMECFRGHYPGNPIMPGVLLCECCFQAGALLIAHQLDPGDWEGVPVLTRIKDARFKRIVRPGETIKVEVTLDSELGGAYFMTGRASVDGEPAVRVEFACMLVDNKENDQ